MSTLPLPLPLSSYTYADATEAIADAYLSSDPPGSGRDAVTSGPARGPRGDVVTPSSLALSSTKQY